jgi:signal transduction histidine kinase
VCKSRYNALKYWDILCHYQAILSSSNDGWIAWNNHGEYVGSSKKFRNLLEIQNAHSIAMADIFEHIEKKDADELAFQLDRLKNSTTSFKMNIKLKGSNQKVSISGTRIIINNLETISLWCSDITCVSSMISKLEEKFLESEEMVATLSEILNTLPMPAWKRNEKLNITYCNKAYSDILDIPAKKILQNNIPLIPGTLFGQGHSLAENARKCEKNQSISQTVTIKGIRKKLFICENHAANKSLIGFAINVTEEEKLSTNLDKVISANYEVLENLSTAIAIFGGNTKLLFFNSSYQKLMKLDAGWLHSNPSYSEILDECRNNRNLPEYADFQAFKKDQLTMFNSVTRMVSDLIHLPNGKTLKFLVAPYPLGGLLFIYEDVTDSLILQRKNNTLLAVQKETIDHLHEGIIVYGSDNRIKIVNNSVMKMWNIKDKTSIDIIGMHLAEMLEHMKEMLRYDFDWEEFKITTLSNLTDRIAKSGKLIRNDNSVILFSYIPLPDGAHMMSCADITDSYVVEKAVMEKNNAIEEANKLKYEFISSISAELKEPINSLIGFTELLSLQYYGTLNEKQQEYCEYILDSSKQLHQLVNNLLEMVLIDNGVEGLESCEFVMSEAINEILATLENRTKEKGVEILTHYEDKNIEFIGDRKRIKQCFFNIFINFAQITSANEILEIRTLIENENLKIVIKHSDSSKGIDSKNHNNGEKNASKVIESRTASMSMVKSIIDMHGGTFNITSGGNGRPCVVCSFPIKNNEIANCGESNCEEFFDSKNNEEKQEEVRNVANA